MWAASAPVVWAGRYAPPLLPARLTRVSRVGGCRTTARGAVQREFGSNLPSHVGGCRRGSTRGCVSRVGGGCCTARGDKQKELGFNLESRGSGGCWSTTRSTTRGCVQRLGSSSDAGAAVVLVGDVHGHLAKLESLWTELEAELGPERFSTARFIFLGDFCDRGPAWAHTRSRFGLK